MYFVIYVNRYSVLGVYILRCVFRGRLDNKYMCVEIRSPLHLHASLKVLLYSQNDMNTFILYG